MASLQRHHTVLRWAQDYGPVFMLRLLWLRVVVVSDPVLVSQVLSRKADANKPPMAHLINKVSRQQCSAPSLGWGAPGLRKQCLSKDCGGLRVEDCFANEDCADKPANIATHET